MRLSQQIGPLEDMVVYGPRGRHARFEQVQSEPGSRMTRQRPRELMRLVSLRGPRIALAVDLAPKVPGSDVVRRMDDNLALLGRPELVKRVVAEVAQITDPADLASTSLEALRGALDQVNHVADLEVDLGGPTSVPIAALSHADAFQGDLLRVYDSWLAQRITGGDPGSLAAHVRLLRAAAVVLEWEVGPERVSESPLETWLTSTRITTPRSWTRRGQSSAVAPARRVARPNAPELGRNDVAQDLRTRLAGVTEGLEAMRQVQSALVEARARWERSRGALVLDSATAGTARDESVLLAVASPNPASDDEIRATLEQRLEAIEGIPTDTHAKLNKLIRERTGMDDLLGNLDVAVDTPDSHLCAEIQAIENAILYDLPPAPNPTKPAQPPLLSSLGLGDLVVARERLVGYEAHEIAHIENVLPGENKVYDTERRHRFETTTEDETTTQTESQTDTDTTDRDTAQSRTQTDLAKSLAVDAGVNVSTKYGATKIEASLDVQFQRSLTASTSETAESVHEIISRTVEREREEVRNLRRTITLDESRVLSHHEIDNTAEAGGEGPEAISGVYRWVEKIEEIELRRYGTRLMVEFHIPEPSVSLLEGQQREDAHVVVTLPPFDVRPADLSRQTYRCLAQRYGTVLGPPPAEWIDVPYHQASTTNNKADYGGKYVHTGLISVPAEYRPVRVTVTVTAPPKSVKATDWKRPYITVAVGTASQRYVIMKDGEAKTQFIGPVIASLWPTGPNEESIGFVTSTAYFDPSATVEQGVPISLSASRADDNAFTAQAVVAAKLTDEAWQAWQLDSWDRLRLAHARKQDELDRRHREAEISQSFGVEVSGRPPSTNRRTERTELKKWSIKALRHETFDFHPMVTEQGLQEIDPSDAEAQAPVTAFFEQSFEWDQMTYLFYPYYWARRDTWTLRQRQRSVDPTHEAFLASGAARVIVAVTPGYERRLLCYLGVTDPGLLQEIPGMDVPCPVDAMTDDGDGATPDFHDVGLDILTERHGDLVRGSGTLAVVQGEAIVTINADSLWAAGKEDVGRELQIDGADYEVVDVTSPTTLVLDRPVETDDREAIAYAAGSLRYSSPWQVRVPTDLVVLDRDALR